MKNLLKILSVAVPLTFTSIFSFGQKDTTFTEFNNDSVPIVTEIKYKGDSIIFEKQYILEKNEYQLALEKTSNLEDGKLIYTNEIEYDYKTKSIYMDSYDKQKLGLGFKERTQIDKFEKSTEITFYNYDDLKRLDNVKTMNNSKGGQNPQTKMEYYLYREENGQPIKWEDNDNNGNFNKGDKMFISVEGKWVEVEPKEDIK